MCTRRLSPQIENDLCANLLSSSFFRICQELGHDSRQNLDQDRSRQNKNTLRKARNGIAWMECASLRDVQHLRELSSAAKLSEGSSYWSPLWIPQGRG